MEGMGIFYNCLVLNGSLPLVGVILLSNYWLRVGVAGRGRAVAVLQGGWGLLTIAGSLWILGHVLGALKAWN
ncbi:MAG: hypothetical protein M3Z04_10625 [Chloroflexota bacterium]|nr:hypothetical protein [Chloroflexota bacterium]